MKIFQDFKTFLSRGNMVDVAVGVIMAGAFSKMVSALVNDMMMPPIGMLLARVNFNDLFLPLDGKSYTSLAAARDAGAPCLAYGAFINSIFEFLLMGAAVFLFVKAINRLRPPEPATPAAPPRSESLLEEIRDLLRQRG